MAKRRLSRLQAVVNRGAGASFELEEAEGVRDKAFATLEQQRDILKLAEAEQQLAEAQLDQYTIFAPFDGTITEIHRKSGTVDFSAPLIAIANLSILEVEMHLPSRLFGAVSCGDCIELRAGRPVSKVLTASVEAVSPVINSASDTFRCLLRTPNSDPGSPAGFSVVLNADIRHKDSGKRSRTADIGSDRSVRAGKNIGHRGPEIVESFR
jgi:multidrug efflux pump subunit AcrA (membrane-fusion protein)